MTITDSELSLLARAEARHGIFTTADLFHLEVPRWVVHSRVETGRWVRIHRGVFRVAGAAPSFEQALLASVLEAGTPTFASHRAAGRVWGVPGFPRSLPEVSRAYGRSNRASAIVHRTTCLPSDHVTEHRAIPVTTVARTMFDLAGVVHPGRAERALDSALSAGLCSVDEVRDVFCSLARRGRRGTAAMRALLTERGADFVAPASELEHRARQLLASSSLPQPEFEVTLGDDDGPIGRVDTLWREAALIVEWDGLRYHASLSAARDDVERDQRFAAQGLRVRRFTWFDVTERPTWVIGQIRAELDVRAAA